MGAAPHVARRTGVRARAVTAAAVVATLVLAGTLSCGRDGGATTLDTPATERAIEQVIGGRLEPPVRAVRCPEKIAKGAGRRFTCRAVLAAGAGEVRLRVRQTAGTTNLEVDLLDAVIDRTAVAEDLRRQLVQTFLRRFTVDCGKGLVVLAPERTLACQAKDPVGRRTVTATVKDAAGTLSYDISPA